MILSSMTQGMKEMLNRKKECGSSLFCAFIKLNIDLLPERTVWATVIETAKK